jgi:xanthine/CO dehydrogenase XdhC/CoxF family maturation factor
MYSLYGSPVEALVETFLPPPRLFIVGAAPDALPLVATARLLGWDVIVCDPVARFTTQARFSSADEILLAPFPEIALRIDGSDRAVVVVANHDDHVDRAVLTMLLSTRARMISVLGPTPRTAQLLADLGGPHGDDRIRLPAAHAAGQTADEVALETIAVLARGLANAVGQAVDAAGRDPCGGLEKMSRFATAYSSWAAALGHTPPL